MIVLDAPAGAVAQFDQPLDLQKGKIGRLLGAQFHGPITIRGTPSRPGATDDILRHHAKRADEHRIDLDARAGRLSLRTKHRPRPRFANASSPFGPAGEHGPGIGGMQTIELLHDVQMRLVSGSGGGIMPMDTHHRDDNRRRPAPQKTCRRKAAQHANRTDPATRFAGARARSGAGGRAAARHPVGSRRRSDGSRAPKKPNAEPDLPVDIRCKGKFRFDMVQYLATFEDQVDVLRTPHDGPSDQMTCEQLIVHFAPRTPGRSRRASGAERPRRRHRPRAHCPRQPNQSDSSNQKIPNLEPRRIEARGNPVIVRAPSNGSYARGEHLDYDIRQRSNSRSMAVMK